ncbi:UNKNOWN [Stylonychia lemnae]|uniref:Uncharacterized protein n=1 Tax=Stylonychia lemnae TaxID=5949 RepID=A0A078AM99_STYLE|nr:UNKNOWN [Stylonychia lemnae]|eukprot:CDW81968.1 UNKNOWN [Stylonychia lemnae]
MIESYLQNVNRDQSNQLDSIFAQNKSIDRVVDGGGADGSNTNSQGGGGGGQPMNWKVLFDKIMTQKKITLNPDLIEDSEGYRSKSNQKDRSYSPSRRQSQMRSQTARGASPGRKSNTHMRAYYGNNTNSNFSGGALDINQRNIEDIYIEYGYNKKKRAIYQDILKQQSQGNKFYLKQLKLGLMDENQKKKKTNFLNHNMNIIRDGSEKVRIINQTLSERKFSKNYLKEKLGNENYKTVILKKASETARDLDKDFELIQEQLRPTQFPLYHTGKDEKFKKSWTLRSLTNSNLIHNPHSNYYHAIKEKLNNNLSSKSRQRLKDESIRKNGGSNGGHIPLFKSPTIKFNQDQDMMLELQKRATLKYLQRQERNKTIQKLKQTFEANYLSNVLKNVNEDIFLFKQTSAGNFLKPKAINNF